MILQIDLLTGETFDHVAGISPIPPGRELIDTELDEYDARRKLIRRRSPPARGALSARFEELRSAHEQLKAEFAALRARLDL